MTSPFDQLPIGAQNRAYLSRVDYSSDDLATVRDRIIARLPDVLSGWNPALADGGGDYGVLMAELFAHMAAILNAYSDQRANEAFPRTATLTRSLIDLADLIDYTLGAGASASALQAFFAKEGKTGLLPAGFKLNAKPASGAAPLVFETSGALDVHPSRNRMRVVGYDRSSRVLTLRASTTAEQDETATLDAQYSGLKAGVPLVFDSGFALVAMPPVSIAVVNGASRIAWARGVAAQDREVLISDLTIHGRPEQTARLAAAERADEITLGHSVVPVANAAMFSVGGAILVDSAGLLIPATVLAATVTASPAGTITLSRGLTASIRRSATRVLEGTSCGYSSAAIRAGSTTLYRDSFLIKKKDFPHTPKPGDLLLIVDASGVEMVTVARASGNDIVLTQPLSRAMRPVAHPFDLTPMVRFFMLDPNDPATHATTVRPVLLGELSGVYVGGNTVLALDKSVDAFAAGGVVGIGDGTTFSAHTIVRTENIDNRTRLTLAGAAPAALKVAFINVYGAFEHAMHIAGYDRSDGAISAGTSQLEIVGTPTGLGAGQDIIVGDATHAEGARITQVQLLSDRTRLSLARPLEHAYALADTTVYGNVVEVTHGASAPDEVLGDGNPAVVPQRFELRRSPLAWVTDPSAPRGVSPALEVFIDGERWMRVDSLADSGPLDRHYVVEIDDRDRAAIVLGDGDHGAPAASGRNNIVARYRTGRGESANVLSGAINQMPQPQPFLDRAMNPAAATGGAERESASVAKRQVAWHVRTLDRAVSLTDYADLARTFAGVADARADMEREGRGTAARRLIVVTCVATGGSALSTPQTEALLAFLRARSPEPDRVRVRTHRAWPIRLALQVHVRPNFQQIVVQRALLETFGNSTGGFFAFDQRNLGTDLVLSSVYAVAEGTIGVDHVLATQFHVETLMPEVADRIVVPADALATGGDSADANVGRLTLQLIGGLS